MHFSNNTVPVSFLYRGAEVGLPRFHSLKVLSHAARFRAAAFTLTTVDSNAALWSADKAEHSSLRMLSGDAACLRHWDSPPLIDLVCEARQGFPHLVENLPALVREKNARIGRIKKAHQCSGSCQPASAFRSLPGLVC